MITKGQAIARLVERALRNAARLSGEDHTADELLPYVKEVGAEIEKFLKDAVYIGTRNRGNFVELIDDLLPQGIAQSTVDDLNEFRRNWYNSAKHDPTFSPATGQLLRALATAKTALVEVVAANLGSTGAPMIRANRRMFHIAAWDHLNGGDTEVHIMPATSGDVFYVPGDIIYIEMSKWHDAVEDLNDLGELRLGRNSVPEQLYETWKAEDDFLDGGTFEGDYRDLLGTLATYELVNDLMPSLKRENHGLSILNATLLAAVDAAAEGDLDDREDDAIDAVIRIASDRYAAPLESTFSNRFVPIIVQTIQALPIADRKSIKGPAWLRGNRYEEEIRDAKAVHSDPAFAVTSDLSLAVRIIE